MHHLSELNEDITIKFNYFEMGCRALKSSLVFSRAVTEILNNKTLFLTNLGDKTLLMMIEANESLVSKCETHL